MSQFATRVALLAILSSLGLAGCGQKGNLYLPNQKKKVPATTSALPTQPDTPPAPASH